MAVGIVLLFVFGVIVVGTLFTIWVIAMIARAISYACSPRRRPMVPTMRNSQFCGNLDCRTENPSHARFCRRCGHSLPMLMKILPDTAAA